MAKYRTPHLNLSTRIEIEVELLLPADKRDWGRITRLAPAALEAILSPHSPDPTPVDKLVMVD